MSQKIAIKVENLSKAYQLGQIGTGTISRDFERWYAGIRGKEDPFLRIGESNDQHVESESNVVWSLKDINFEIAQGDAVGIIGRNGAGKSTLLKILSKVTAPTTGKVSGEGRIASLLEVGTGFHPELSGRENIFLNGAIFGMRNKEIQRKLDEIVDFAGIERYLDTPVKRYSSGMYVRLAFAVAAHLESEILIVDEVLAVGDAEFQKKCLGKMGDVSKGEGRTVLFVSHNMASIKTLCKSGIYLNNGEIFNRGKIDEVINSYKNATNKDSKTINDLIVYQDSNLKIDSISLNNKNESIIDLKTDNTLNISIIGVALSKFKFNIEIRISSMDGKMVFFYSPAHIQNELLTYERGLFEFTDKIALPTQMVNGTYLVALTLSYPNVNTYLSIENLQIVKDTMITFSGRNLNYDDVGFLILERYNGK